VFSGASFRVIIQLQYSVFWWLFLSYNSGSVLRFLVVDFVLLFSFSILFSGGRF
jgi:hypothetical protein